jgi:RNA polymerase sigma-70 factor (ECF subfamily)
VQDVTGQAELNDDDLVAAIAGGDRRAFEVLVCRYDQRLFRFARSLVRSDAEAEDVVQETFLSSWRSLTATEGAPELSSVRGWLYAICRHAAYRRGRRRAGQPAEHEPLESLVTLGAQAGWGSEEAPEQLSAALESRDVVRRALLTLSDEDRDIVWLRDIGELSGEEAAEVLGISLAAEKSRLHRARLKLLAALRETGGGEP